MAKRSSRSDDRVSQDASPSGGVRRSAPRSWLLACGAVIFLAVVFGVAGGAWAIVTYRLLTDVLLAVLWLAAAIGLGSLLPIPVTQPERCDDGVVDDDAASPGDSYRSLRLSTAAGLGLGAMSLAVLGLGLLGWLNGATAWGLVVAGSAAGVVGVVRRGGVGVVEDGVRRWLAAPAKADWLWLLLVPSLAIAVVGAMGMPGALWSTVGDPHGYDVLAYHLQVPREWYEGGRITPLRHNAFSFFPFNVEMHYLLAMHLRGGPWAGMYLAQLTHVAFVGLTVAAVHGVARALGARPVAATVGALAAGATPWLLLLAPVGYNEGGLLLWGTLAVGWSILAVGGAGGVRVRRFALAGAFAGLACGAKLTGVPTVLAAGAAASLVALLTAGRRRSAPAAAAVVTAELDLPPAAGTGSSSTPPELDAAAPPAKVPGRRPLHDTGEHSHDNGAGIIGGARAGDSSSPAAPSERPRPSIFAAFAGPLVFGVVGLLVFAPWLVRNVAWVGNPVFPELMPLLGQGHFSDVQVERWRRAHAAQEDERSPQIRAARGWERIVVDWRFGYVVLPLVGAAVVLTGWRDHGVRVVVLVLACLLVFWLAMTHLQSRFFVLAVPLAALLVARVRWRHWPAVAVPLVACAATLGWARTAGPAGRVLLDLDPAELPVIAFGGGGNEPLAKRVVTAERVTLVGDAKAFLFPTPPGGLRYRTVFDVDTSNTDDIVAAWRGGDDAMAGGLTIVHPGELRRLASTYWRIPELPPDLREQPVPFALPAPAAQPAVESR